MKSKSPIFSKTIIFILLFVVSFSIDSYASHYRGGTLSWQQAGGNDITFTLNTQWRYGAFSGLSVGQTTGIGSIGFGDGTSTGIIAIVNAVDAVNDVIYMTWTYTKTYGSAGNFNVSALNSCCRINNLGGNSNTNYHLETIVNVGSPFNNPPISNIPAQVNLPINASAATFAIPASDPDGDLLTYRIATNAESGLNASAPTGFALSSDGIATMNTVGNIIGDTYVVMVMVEDGSTKTAVEFLLKMVGPSDPPVFLLPLVSTILNVTPPNNSINFSISAEDPDAGQSVTLNPVALPIGATTTPILPVTSSVDGTATSNFSWIPTPAQVGTYVITFVAQDNVGVQSQRSIQINVLCPLDATAIVENTGCGAYENTGEIVLTPSSFSSSANLLYTWNGPSGFSSPGNVPTASSLGEGNYSVRVDDSGTGCFIIKNYNVSTVVGPTTPGPVANIQSGETYCSIQNAIDDAANGDLITMGSGTLDESADGAGSGVQLSAGNSPGCVILAGNFTLDNSNVFVAELDGSTACTQFDQMQVDGIATLGGAALDIQLGYPPADGDIFQILTSANPIAGTFAEGFCYVSSFGGNDYYFSISYTGNAVKLTAGAGPIAVNTNTENTYCTIQAAIDDPATINGHTITVADGTYNERVNLNKSLTIAGASMGGTIIDGTGLSGTGKGIFISPGVENVIISNLTVQNFAGSNGNIDAGIYAAGGNNQLAVDHVAIQDNVGGSGFYANGPIDNVALDYVTSSGHTVGARGIVIWNGLKSNISITNCTVFNNNCCGIELQDGDATGVNVSNNIVYNNGDNGIGLVGLTGPNNNTVNNNDLDNNGRFGIEVKNPNGFTTVSGNDVSRNTAIGDQRDIVGIAVFRRGVVDNNVDVPFGVNLTGNTVTGYEQTSQSEGFGIVIEGSGHTVSGNTLSGNDIGIQQQAGHLPYPGDGDQSNLNDQFFGRGNAPITCGNNVGVNTFNSNGTDSRNVNTGGSVLNDSSGNLYCTIQAAIDDAASGDEIRILDADYTEPGQIVVDKDISLKGMGIANTVLRPGINTSTSGDARGFILVNENVTFGLENLTIDGSGRLVWQAVRQLGDGTIDQVKFTEIKYNPSSNYQGTAIAALGSGDVNVTNCEFMEVGRIGVIYFGTGITGANFTDNLYTGKGTGDWLDYALDISAGAVVNVTNNTISGNVGVASVDGSKSAGVLVSTYFGGGTQSTITGNNISNNSCGIAVGFDGADASVVVANNNDFSGNNEAVTTTGPFVDAANNYWGAPDGPSGAGPGSGDAIVAGVNACPYYDDPVATGSLVDCPVQNMNSGDYYYTIQAAIDAASPNDVLEVLSATHTEGQIVFDKSLTLQGQGAGNTTVFSDYNTATAGHGNDASAWLRTEPGTHVTVRNLTLHGNGNITYTGLRFKDGGAVDGVTFNDIVNGNYGGIAVQIQDGNVDIENSTFTNIGRIGAHYRAGVIPSATISGLYKNNTYTGKGAGDWLDYALDISGAVTITVEGNTISNNTGVAASDGSASAGILVTSYFPTPANSVANNVTITGNVLTGNTSGVAVGYDANDISVVAINDNFLSGNDFGVTSTGPNVNATCNWYGTSVYSEISAKLAGPINFVPYLIDDTDNDAGMDGFQPVAGTCVGGPVRVYSDAGLSAQVSGHTSIQAAIDDATTLNGYAIQVDAGIYDEVLIINKSLTVLGPNAYLSCGSRVAEAVLSPAAGTPVTITADGVLFSGFEITAPDAFNAINFGGISNATLSFNNIHDIGTNKTGGGNVHALLYTVGSSNTNSIAIEDNCLNNISSSSLSGSSASAIGILQSTSTGVLDVVNIARNTISNVNVNTGAWPIGKIAYGIQINVAGGSGFASSTGNAKNVNISHNDISDVQGFIATAIGLEGNTEDASIENNNIWNLSAYKSANRAGGGLDLNGLKFENNRYVSTVIVNGNSFQTNTFTHNGMANMGYAIANYVPELDGGIATLICNWFGTSDISEIDGTNDLDGKLFTKVGAEIEYLSFLLDDAENNASQIGFDPAGICTLPNSASFVLTPSVTTTATCDEFTVMVSVETDVELNLAEARMTFPASLLEVVSITAPDDSPLPSAPLLVNTEAPQFDNGNGTLSYKAQLNGNSGFPSTDFDFFKITFKVLGDAGVAEIASAISFPQSIIAISGFQNGVAVNINLLDEFNPIYVAITPDVTDPVITCIGDPVVNTDLGQCYYTVLGAEFDPVSSSDNCAVTGITNNFNNAATLAGAQIPDGTSIEWTAVDAAGNDATCSFNVTVTDNEDPIVSCKPVTLQLDGSGNAVLTAADVNNMSTDNCGIASESISQSSFDCSHIGANTVILTITDVNGRTSSCNAIVTVEDNIMPSINGPADITVELSIAPDPFITGMATGSDNCSFEISYADDRSGLIGCNGTGTLSREFTVTDAGGNTVYWTQTITIEDTEDPLALTCPSDITQTADAGQCSAVVSFASTENTFDNKYVESFEDVNFVSGNAVTLPHQGWNDYGSHMSSVASGTDGIASSDGGYHAVIDTNNSIGQTGVFSRLGAYSTSFGDGYTVQTDIYMDLSDPGVLANTYGWDLSVASNGQDGGHQRDFIFHSASNASGNILIGGSNNSNSTVQTNLATGNHYEIAASGWYTFEWVFRDNGSDQLAVDLNLKDNTGAVIFTETRSTPADVISTEVGGNRYMWFTFLSVENLAIDNVKMLRNVETTTDYASGDVFNVGTTTVTSTATDACGKLVTCSFDVTVTDDEVPTVSCQAVTVQLDANGDGTLVASALDNGSSDNCGSPSLGVLGCPDGLTYNQNTTSEVIFGDGNGNGFFTLGNGSNVELGLRAKVRYPSPSETYNSNGDGSYNHLAGAFGGDGMQSGWNFEWSINTDQDGTSGQNLDALTYELGLDFDPTDGVQFLVQDPINLPFADHAIGDNSTTNGDGASAVDDLDYAALIAGNNVAQNSWRHNFFGAFNGNLDGRYEVYLKAFDSNGVLVAQTAISVIVGAGTGNAYAGCLMPLASKDYDCSNTGVFAETLVVIDASGNSSTCTANVTVVDGTPPSFTCAADAERFVSIAGNYVVVGTEFDPTNVSDNCSGNLTITHNAEFYFGDQSLSDNTLAGWSIPVGTHTIIFTVSDGTNSVTCDIAIEVKDLSLSGNVTMNLNCTPIPIRIELYTPAVYDNAVPPNVIAPNVLVGTFTGLVDTNGDFQIDLSGVTPGTYAVFIKVDTYLQQFIGDQLIDGATTGISLTSLKPGDIAGTAFGNNNIGPIDLSLLVGAYNTQSMDAAYNARADLDCNGQVDGLDMSLLIFFYSQTGDTPQN